MTAEGIPNKEKAQRKADCGEDQPTRWSLGVKSLRVFEAPRSGEEGGVRSQTGDHHSHSVQGSISRNFCLPS